MPSRLARRRGGFTLVELLVVLGIMAMLVGLLLPAVQSVRRQGQKIGCMNNLQQLGRALHTYYDLHGNLPPAYLSTAGLQADGTPGRQKFDLPGPDAYKTALYPGWSWVAHLLPQLEQGSLTERFDFPFTGNAHPGTEFMRQTELKILYCPADQHNGIAKFYDQNNKLLYSAGTTSYVACFGSLGNMVNEPTSGNGLLYCNSKVRAADVHDGLSNTVALGERASLFVQSPWVGPLDRATTRTTLNAPVYQAFMNPTAGLGMARFGNRFLNDPWSDPEDFFSPHRDSIQLLFGDGSVRSAKRTVAPEVLQAVGTRSGGEQNQPLE